MTRDIDYQIAVMQAFKDGKKIEYKLECASDITWASASSPTWDWFNNDYRVKKEPKYVPYKNTEELIEDFCKRSGVKRSPMGEPFIWVKSSSTKRLITTYTNDMVYTQFNSGFAGWSMSELLESFTFLDGSPIGKEVK